MPVMLKKYMSMQGILEISLDLKTEVYWGKRTELKLGYSGKEKS